MIGADRLLDVFADSCITPVRYGDAHDH